MWKSSIVPSNESRAGFEPGGQTTTHVIVDSISATCPVTTVVNLCERLLGRS